MHQKGEIKKMTNVINLANTLTSQIPEESIILC